MYSLGFQILTLFQLPFAYGGVPVIEGAFLHYVSTHSFHVHVTKNEFTTGYVGEVRLLGQKLPQSGFESPHSLITLNYVTTGHYYNVSVFAWNACGIGPAIYDVVATEMNTPVMTGISTTARGDITCLNIAWINAADANSHHIRLDNLTTMLFLENVSPPYVHCPYQREQLIIQVIANYEVGSTSAGATIGSGLLPGAIPSTVSNSKLSMYSFQLSWGGAENVDTYHIKISRHGLVLWNGTTMGNTVTVADLAPGCRYNVSIFGRNAYGDGPTLLDTASTATGILAILSVTITNESLAVNWNGAEGTDYQEIEVYSGSSYQSEVVETSPFVMELSDVKYPLKGWYMKIDADYELSEDVIIYFFGNGPHGPTITSAYQTTPDELVIEWEDEGSSNDTHNICIDSYISDPDLPILISSCNEFESSPSTYALANTMSQSSIHYITIFNTSLTASETFILLTGPNPCDTKRCASNASCLPDGMHDILCNCDEYFKGDGKVGCFAYCKPDNVSGYTFEEAYASMVSYSRELCASGRPMASAVCNIDDSKTYFDPSTITTVACDQTISESVNAVDVASTPEVEDEFDDLQVLTSTTGTLTEYDVSEVVSFYDEVAVAQVAVNEDALSSCVVTASQLTVYYRSKGDNVDEDETDEKESLLISLSSIARRVDVAESPSDVVEYETTTNDIITKIVDIPEAVILSSRETDITFQASFYDLNYTGLQVVAPVEFILPWSAVQSAYDAIVDGAGASKTVRTVFFAHRDSTLFPSDEKAEWVTSAEIGDKTQVYSSFKFNDLVEIRYNHLNATIESQVLPEGYITAVECVYWDFIHSNWSSQGLHYDEDNETCYSNHLTNFAVLTHVMEDPCKTATCAENAACVVVGTEANCVCAGEYFKGDGYSGCSAYCKESIVSIYHFSEALVGMVAYSLEKCDSTRSIASAVCESSIDGTTNGFYTHYATSSLDAVECNVTIRGTLSKDISSPSAVEREFGNLQILTSNPESMSDEEVLEVVEFYFAVAESDVAVDKEGLEDCILTVSHLTDFYRLGENSEAGEDRESLLLSMSSIARRANMGENAEDGSEDFESTTGDIVTKIANIIPVRVREYNDVTFTPIFYDINQTGNLIKPTLTLPWALIQAAEHRGESKIIRTIFFSHRDSTLFPSDENTQWVTSAEIGDKTESYEHLAFNGAIKIKYNTLSVSTQRYALDKFEDNVTQLQCAFWNFDTSSWSPDGTCYDEDHTTCNSDHLTNFAILVTNKVVPSKYILDIVSTVGCCFSICGLILTIGAILFLKKIRSRRPMRVLLHLCICLTIFYFFFVFGIDQTANHVTCDVMTILLHYWLLASWCWMAVYSHLLYLLVKVMTRDVAKQYNMIIVSAFAYGVPLVIVALDAGISLGYIDANQEPKTCDDDDVYTESSYRAEQVCWLHDLSFYLGFVLPVSILLMFNIVVFGMVLPTVTWNRNQIRSSLNRKKAKSHLVTAIVLSTTMGLSWIFGYLMLFSSNEVYLVAMSWVFSLLNCFQGFLIFISTCVRSGEVQRAIRDSFGKGADNSTRVSKLRSWFNSSKAKDEDTDHPCDATITQQHSEEIHPKT